MSDLTEALGKALFHYLADVPDLAEEANKAGVSVGFLAHYIAQNIDESIRREIALAAQCGELYCPKCEPSAGIYYNYKSVQLKKTDKGELSCPQCNTVLVANTCSNCGDSTDRTVGRGKFQHRVYEGAYVDGMVCCHICTKLLANGSRQHVKGL